MSKILSNKSVFCTLFAVALVLVISGFAITRNSSAIRLESEEERQSYISSLGITVADTPPVIRNIIIPADFPPVYDKYNELQKESGFDLYSYRGEYAVQYTYTVVNYINDEGEAESNVRVNLILHEGKLIGGDISSTRLDGFMKGLG